MKAENIEVAQKQFQEMSLPIDCADFATIMAKEKPLFALRKIFGHGSFRGGQQETIESVLQGKDTIALLPTGGGKTAIYTILSVLLEGVTIVVQPLKSLMEEQVVNLRQKGIAAYFVNSSLPDGQIAEVINILCSETVRYAILFTGPEWLQGIQMKKCLQVLKRQKKLKLLTVDEAHCIDLWGGSFRSSYSNLAFMKNYEVPVLALSGSATPRTIEIIKTSLKLDHAFVSKMSFQRKNLELTSIKKGIHGIRQIVSLIHTNHANQCGIIYCSKRNTTQDISHELKQQGISSSFIHGGLEDYKRRYNEKTWRENRTLVMCATKSFCMGIDKSDVKFVYHFDMPKSFEDYFQQISRAGRDGSRGVCCLMFSVQDRTFHIQNLASLTDEVERTTKLENLNAITEFCLQNTECRHKMILQYFGEDISECEENCDVCRNPKRVNQKNMIEEAKIVLQCFKEMKRLSSKVTARSLQLTLLGSNSSEIQIKGFGKCSSFGAGKKFTNGAKDRKLTVQRLILTLILKKILIEQFKQGNNQSTQRNKKLEIEIDYGDIEKLYSGESILL